LRFARAGETASARVMRRFQQLPTDIWRFGGGYLWSRVLGAKGTLHRTAEWSACGPKWICQARAPSEREQTSTRLISSTGESAMRRREFIALFYCAPMYSIAVRRNGRSGHQATLAIRLCASADAKLLRV